LGIKFKIVIAKCKDEEFQNTFVERRRVVVKISSIADALDDEVMTHISVKRLNVCSKE